MLTDITGKGEEEIDLDAGTISDILDELYTRYPQLRSAEFKVAQNNSIVSANSELTDSEIALLPPFSGG